MKRLVVLAFVLAACGSSTGPLPVASPSQVASPTASQSPNPTCAPTDQDNYVYNPDRLSVQAACIRVTGEVLAKVTEADGDYHVRVLLDAAYSTLLRPANVQQCANNDAGVRTCGLLVVEPVCEHSITQADAVSACVNDKDPVSPLPAVGQHVWLEGRYVFDLDHGGWAELHPLYRWGAQ